MKLGLGLRLGRLNLGFSSDQGGGAPEGAITDPDTGMTLTDPDTGEAITDPDA